MTDKKIILTTAGTKDEAQDIAWALLERKQAACVNIVAVDSVYLWKSEIENNAEHMLIIKTTAEACAKVQETIKELNSYDVPEYIEIPIEAGSESYLQWVASCVAPQSEESA